MPTISVYLNDEDYTYYKKLEQKAEFLRWAFRMHRKAAEQKLIKEEPQYVPTQD